MSTAEIKQRVIEVAQQYRIDPNIALEQINAESSFNPNANSGQAKGLTQFTPATFAVYGNGGDIWDVEDSLQAYGRYMRHLLDYFDGDYRLAIAGYHSGEGSAKKALNNPAGNPKTVAYVNKILGSAGKSDYGFGTPREIFDLGDNESDDTFLYWMLGGGLLLALLLRR